MKLSTPKAKYNFNTNTIKSQTLMKKFTLIAAAALMGLSASAQTNWANPKAADGTYVVQYDLENGKFFDENTFEFDETFVFALDVTGTPLADIESNYSRLVALDDALKGIGVAYDIYMTSRPEGSPTANLDGRLFHIKDNVYGMTLNLYQFYNLRPGKKAGMKDAEGNIAALEIGNVASFNESFFNFGWSASNAGMYWWDGVTTPIQGEMEFHTVPYTGTKTSPEFYFGDLVPADECGFDGLDAGAYHGMCDDWGGYARPEDYEAAISSGAINEVSVNTADVVATEYFDVMGRKVNGALENGITLKRDMLSNGKAVVTKIAR